MEIANTKKQEEKTQWKVYRKKREKEIAASITLKGLYLKVVFLARLGIGSDFILCAELKRLIVDEKFSPYAVIAEF